MDGACGPLSVFDSPDSVICLKNYKFELNFLNIWPPSLEKCHKTI